MYIPFNPNPNGLFAEDCVVRAISIATGRSWDDTYIQLCMQGFLSKNMPSVNSVWGTYLYSLGFDCFAVNAFCSECNTVRDFCYENPKGIYILATGSHLVTVIDGDYYDAWDSGDEVPISVWRRDIYGD